MDNEERRELLIEKFVKAIDDINHYEGAYPKQVMIRGELMWLDIDLRDD